MHGRFRGGLSAASGLHVAAPATLIGFLRLNEFLEICEVFLDGVVVQAESGAGFFKQPCGVPINLNCHPCLVFGQFVECDNACVVDLPAGTVSRNTLIGVLFGYLSLKLALDAADFHFPLSECVGHLCDGFNKIEKLWKLHKFCPLAVRDGDGNVDVDSFDGFGHDDLLVRIQRMSEFLQPHSQYLRLMQGQPG